MTAPKSHEELAEELAAQVDKMVRASIARHADAAAKRLEQTADATLARAVRDRDKALAEWMRECLTHYAKAQGRLSDAEIRTLAERFTLRP